MEELQGPEREYANLRGQFERAQAAAMHLQDQDRQARSLFVKIASQRDAMLDALVTMADSGHLPAAVALPPSYDRADESMDLDHGEEAMSAEAQHHLELLDRANCAAHNVFYDDEDELEEFDYQKNLQSIQNSQRMPYQNVLSAGHWLERNGMGSRTKRPAGAADGSEAKRLRI